MTLSFLQSELARLPYRDPGAGTNVHSIENVGTDVRFVVDESELRAEISQLTHSNEAFERSMVDAMRERDAARAKLAECPDLPDDMDPHNPEAVEVFMKAFTAWKRV